MTGEKPQTGTEKRVKVLKIDKTRDDERGRCLMIIEDESIKSPERFATAIAPKDFNARVGGYISKTREVNYVKPHMGNISEIEKMYSHLLKESR